MSRSSSTVSAPRKSSTVKGAPIVDVPTSKAPPEIVAPVAPVSLANATSDVQAQAIIDALKLPALSVVAAALALHKGNATSAADELSAKNLPALVIVSRIIPILRNSAPSALFTDGNNRGARVGELFASRLGLGAQYRNASRASLKDARAALVESAK